VPLLPIATHCRLRANMEEAWVRRFGELFDDDFEQWPEDEDQGEDDANDRWVHQERWDELTRSAGGGRPAGPTLSGKGGSNTDAEDEGVDAQRMGASLSDARLASSCSPTARVSALAAKWQ
jgi:hypothetical protein